MHLDDPDSINPMFSVVPDVNAVVCCAANIALAPQRSPAIIGMHPRHLLVDRASTSVTDPRCRSATANR